MTNLMSTQGKVSSSNFTNPEIKSQPPTFLNHCSTLHRPMPSHGVHLPKTASRSEPACLELICIRTRHRHNFGHVLQNFSIPKPRDART
jgi:hypothetical protein